MKAREVLTSERAVLKSREVEPPKEIDFAGLPYHELGTRLNL